MAKLKYEQERTGYVLHVHPDVEKFPFSLLIKYDSRLHLIPNDRQTILNMSRDDIIAVYVVYNLDDIDVGKLTRGDYGRSREISLDELISEARSYDGGPLLRRLPPEVWERLEGDIGERSVERARQRRRADAGLVGVGNVKLD